MKVEDYGATQPVGGNNFDGQGSVGSTEAVNSAGFGGMSLGTTGSAGNFGGFGGETGAVNNSWNNGGWNNAAGETEPVNNGGWNNNDWNNNGWNNAGGWAGNEGTKPPTEPLQDMANYNNMAVNSDGVDNYDGETRPINPGGVAGFTPVVGWLVCIDGPDKGTDYRIRTGYNNIGRAENMDICIRGDMQISREKAATIAYDDQEKIFFFAREASINTVRVNGKMVMVPTQIEAYDILTIGSSRFIFVPLCGDKFDWE